MVIVSALDVDQFKVVEFLLDDLFRPILVVVHFRPAQFERRGRLRITSIVAVCLASPPGPFATSSYVSSIVLGHRAIATRRTVPMLVMEISAASVDCQSNVAD